MKRFVVLPAVFFWMVSAASAAAPITTESLLRDMTDLATMAEFPDPAYTCKQFSSYDRRSTDPKALTEGNWFANGDCGQYIRVEERSGRKEHVMMDAQGPGAIVRIWSANPNGVLRVYIDGADAPALEAKMTDLLGGGFPGLPKPLAGEYSKGWNLYLPIPYARSCKVTSDQGGFYYHVNYRTYPAGTPVTSFRPGQVNALRDTLAALAKRLATPRNASPLPADAAGQDFEVTINPGDSIVNELPGPGAVVRVAVKVAAADRDAALRGVVVLGEFDGEKTIESPLGDFFGTGPGVNVYESLPLGMTADGEMWCNWVMPYKTGARFTLVNHTKAPVTITGTLTCAAYKWTDRSMHFHARWRMDFDRPSRPMIDWNYLAAKGKGVFAGVAFAIDNPVKDWWGEGDEKIYVDGEKFPSHFGTGTEDYYGYAWCCPEKFVHAYHNQPRCDGPGNFGRTSVNRWHIIDRIPFASDFRFDMELWHWKPDCKVNMSVTSYWYALPGGTDEFKAIQPADVVLRPAPVIQIMRVPGAIEGEAMKIIDRVGELDPQDWDGLSGGVHLWWHAGMKPGDTITLGFNAPKAGKYRVFGRFLSAVDYGSHQLAINGQKAGGAIDFFSPTVQPTGQVDLGVYDLREGENRLSVTVTGANLRATGVKHMFGLDYLLLKPAE